MMTRMRRQDRDRASRRPWRSRRLWPSVECNLCFIAPWRQTLDLWSTRPEMSGRSWRESRSQWSLSFLVSQSRLKKSDEQRLDPGLEKWIRILKHSPAHPCTWPLYCRASPEIVPCLVTILRSLHLVFVIWTKLPVIRKEPLNQNTLSTSRHCQVYSVSNLMFQKVHSPFRNRLLFLEKTYQRESTAVHWWI